ncbi:MAG: methyl-accepting chemotaxis protein [bacterium]
MKLKIGTKLIGGFFIVSLLVAIAGGLGISAMKRISKAADKVINEEVPIVRETLNLKAYSVVARDAMAEYLLKGTNELEELDKINNEFGNTIKAIETRTQALISGNEDLNIHALASESQIASVSKEILTIVGKLNDNADKLMKTHRESLELKPQSGAKMEEMDSLADELIQNARTQNLSVDTITSLWAQVMAVNDYLITGENEEIEAFEEAYNIVCSDPKYQTVKTLHTKVTQLGKETIELYKKYHEKAETTNSLMHDVDEVSEGLMGLADKISHEAIKGMNQSIVSAQRVKKASQNLLIVITTIAFIAAIGIGLFLTKGITKPIALCVEFAQRIANGDLSKKVEIDTKDETRDLGDALNGMLVSLRNAIDDINQKVDYLNKVPTPVLVIDKNYEVTFMNEAGAKAIGKTVDACVGQKCYNLFDTDHCNSNECRCRQAMEKDGLFMGETISRGAGDIFIQYTAASMKDKDGNIIGALEYVTNISAIKEQQNYLEKSAREISDVMAKFANGDLTIRLDKNQEDEIGLIIDNINLAVTKIREMVVRIRDAASNVAVTGEQISAATDQITKGAQNQASAADETGSTMEEMSVQIMNVARNAEGLASNVDETTSSIQQMGTTSEAVAKMAETMAGNVSETSSSIEQMIVMLEKTATNVNEADKLSTLASNEATNGAEAVLKMVEGMKIIGDMMENISGVIQNLGKRSEAIGSIVKVIEEIADQTNLLALNAAIEAARAGEAGQGFAVVADEVRKLAERSVKATKEIGDVIKEVQSETSSAVKATDDGANSSKEGIVMADQAGSAISKITEAVKATSNIMQEISAATSEQSTAAKSVIGAIEEMNKLTQSVTQSTNEQAAGIKQVVKASEAMSQLTEQVKNATMEQKKGGENVVKAVENISDIAKGNLSAVEQLSRSAKNMAQQSEGLQEMVQAFKTN